MSRQSQRPLSVAWRTILGRLGIFLIGVALVSSCASRPLRLDAAPWETALATDHVALPAVFVKGRPYVDLSVNGHGPYRFLVDTGSVGTAISQPVAKEAGIAASRKYWARVTGSSGQSEHQPMGTVDHLEAPGFSLGTVDVSIISPQSAALLDPPAKKFIGGIIGLSAFRNVRLEIDYAGKQVVVHRLDTETPPAGAGIAYTGSRPTVSIATPSTLHATTNAVIDTGSDSGFSLTDIGSYPLRVGLAKKDGYHHGVGGFWRPLFGQVAGDIRLGSAIWRDAMISSADENRIGGEALGSWRLVIDQQKKLLWLLHENQMETTTWTGPLDVDGRPAVYGFACISEGDSFVIREVDPGSRAERAGLKVGDRVVPGKEDGDPSRAVLDIVRGDQKLKIVLSLPEPPARAAPRR